MDIPSRVILKILVITSLFAAGIWFILAAHVVLIWLGTAFVLALAINPAVVLFERWAPWLRRGGAVAVVFVGLLILIVFFAYTLVPPLVSESQQLIREWPHYVNQFLNSSTGQLVQRYRLVSQVKSSQSQLISLASHAGGSVVTILQRIFASFIAALTTTVFVIFMLLEGPYWSKLLFQLMPPGQRKDSRRLAIEMYEAVAGYMGSKLLMSLIAAVVTFVLLEILSIPYALSLALIVAIFDLIPLVGATIGAAIVVVVSLFTSPIAALVIAVFFLIFQQVEDHIIQPLVMRHTVQLTSLTIIVAALLGAEVAGIVGALVAIPIAACIHIYLRERYGHRLTA